MMGSNTAQGEDSILYTTHLDNTPASRMQLHNLHASSIHAGFMH
jgi:hypothetical protein